MERLDDGVGGPKATARPGDILLENDHMRVTVQTARNSRGPGLYGGSILDVDLQWNDARFPAGYGNDQFAELFPTVNMNVVHPGPNGVRIIADGSDGGPAIVRVEGPAEPFLTMLGALWAIVRAPAFGLVTDYIAEPGKPWITIRSTVTVRPEDGALLSVEGEPVDFSEDMPLLTWAIETGLVLGDFYLQGGSIDVFAPGMGFDEDGEVYAAMQRGENIMQDPFLFDFIGGVGEGISYGISSAHGGVFIPLFSASQTAVVGGGKPGDGTNARFETGATYTYERQLFVGHGDMGSIVDAWVQARDIPHGQVSGHVLEATTGLPLSGIDVFVYEPGAERPWSQWRTDVDPRDRRADGSFGGRLPVGDWELLVHRPGMPRAERLAVRVEEGEKVRVQLQAARPGVLTFRTRDEIGRDLPSKVSIFRVDAPSERDPILGDGFIAGSPESVVFSLYGRGEVELPPGEYVAVASRGIEYELHITEPFRVDEAHAHHVNFQLLRSVVSDGWISADLHVHAVPSHDSGVLLADRVRTMVAEGVEFFASTDHDRLTDYAPVVEHLGVGQWVSTAVGNETTTLEIGHFLGFPLAMDHLADAGGAMDWTGKSPGEILATLRGQGRAAGHDPALFVGHPRDGILGYFDQYGLDPYGGSPGFGGMSGSAAFSPSILSATNPLLHVDNFSWDFHALELLNAKRMDILRTPTQPEADRFARGEPIEVYEMMERTLDEQQDLKDGVYRLAHGVTGAIDDWFTLLNLGFRFTALGNSDTHGLTSTEAGCPRNFVFTGVDDPAFVTGQMVADAVREHRVVASYGPFMQMWVDGHPIGSELVPQGDTIELTIEVQAPTWMGVDRVELYENGTLIQEWHLDAVPDVLRFFETIELQPDRDSWYVAIAMGDDDLAPVFTPVEIPYIELDMVVREALGGIEAVSALLSPATPMPREYAVHPFAVTNPIWVDLDGDGFDAPGRPAWLLRPEAPADEEE